MAVEVDLLNANSINNIDTNFQRVSIALEDAVSRSGNTPNQMNADFDMNSHDLINVGELSAQSVVVNGVPIGQFASTFRGLWNVGASYIVNDVVRDTSGNLWIAKRANTGVPPVEGDDWSLFMPGATVADGSIGAEQTDGSFGWAEFDTTVEASSYSPLSAPASIRTRGYASVNDGGGAFFIRVMSEPSHPGKFSITLDDGVTVVWYEIAETVLRPEMFGTIGTNAAGDTAAWVAMVAVINARGGQAEVVMEKPRYLINGTGVTNDSQTIKDIDSIWIRLGVTTEVRQQNPLSKSIKFVNVPKMRVTNGHFIGYAQIQIDANQPLTELNLDTSSGNAVAAIYAEYNNGLGAELLLEGVRTTNHFGRDIVAYGIQYITGRNLDLCGVGPTYNDPSGGAYPTYYPIPGPHQGNGEDAAIYAIPNDYSVNGTAWLQELDISHSRIKWHSFCIRTILNRVLRLHGNTFGETPGQHHVYDSDSDGISVIGNQFEDCRQIGLKMQLENRAGTEYGPLYDANHPGYQVGDVVRAFSILWVCHTAYVPGGAGFSSANWNQHPRFLRQGGVIQGNTFRNCGEAGIGGIASSPVFARNIWFSGYIIKGNDVQDSNSGIYIDRMWESTIQGNNIRRCVTGIFGRDFYGTISENDIQSCDQSAIVISVSRGSTFENNKFWNNGHLGADNGQRAAVLLYPPDANAPPGQQANPRIFFRSNGLLFTPDPGSVLTDGSGDYHVWGSDPRLQWEIEGTWGTPTVRQFRIDGSVVYQFRNHFNGYFNTAQNEPTWNLSNWSTQFGFDANGDELIRADAIATLFSILNGKRVIRTTG